MTADRSLRPGVQLHHWLEQEMAKLAECRWAGIGHLLFRPGEPLDGTIRRLYGRDHPDWVIIIPWERLERLHGRNIWTNFRAPEPRAFKIAAHICTLHATRELKVTRDSYIDAINEMNLNALLMRYRQIPQISASEYERRLKPKIFHLPTHVSPSVYRPDPRPKLYEVSFIGSIGRQYPLRASIFRHLPALAERHGWRCLCWKKTHRCVLKYPIPVLLARGDYVGQRYIEAIGRSKILIFGTSRYRYFVQKFVEGMACETLVMSDEPMDAGLLHLEPGENYVKISQENWAENLEYYLRHDSERRRIARRGRKTVLKYHTSQIRAKELINFLESQI